MVGWTQQENAQKLPQHALAPVHVLVRHFEWLQCMLLLIDVTTVGLWRETPVTATFSKPPSAHCVCVCGKLMYHRGVLASTLRLSCRSFRCPGHPSALSTQSGASTDKHSYETLGMEIPKSICHFPQVPAGCRGIATARHALGVFMGSTGRQT